MRAPLTHPAPANVRPLAAQTMLTSSGTGGVVEVFKVHLKCDVGNPFIGWNSAFAEPVSSRFQPSSLTSDMLALSELA